MNEHFSPGFGASGDYADRMEKMYPDLYRQMMPYIESTTAGLETPDLFTEEAVNAMAYQAARDSGLLANPALYHNESALVDIAKALLLISLYNRFPTYPARYPMPHPHPHPFPAPAPPMPHPIRPGFRPSPRRPSNRSHGPGFPSGRRGGPPRGRR